jgi:hypothetical protein
LGLSGGVAFVIDPDSRCLLARPDLAEQALEGLVPAARYRPTRPWRCRIGFAPITDEGGDPIGEILFGEAFDLLEEVDGRGWGRARRDGTVGHVDLDLLEPLTVLPIARVATTDARVPLNALMAEADEAEPEHLADFHSFDPDLATAAERLLGASYRLGGRSRAGLDCAGLVQQALFACGHPGPRWADGQARLGRAIAASDRRRGDLVIWLRTDDGPGIWTGHAAIVVDATSLIHASGTHGAVVVEDFVAADGRCRADGLATAVFRRL